MTTASRTEHEFAYEISNWLTGKESTPPTITNSELADRLGVTCDWVDELERATDQFNAAMRAESAGATVILDPPTGGEPVADDDQVVVILDSVVIRRMFTDSERSERNDQEGTVYFDVNGQTTTLAWERLRTTRRPPRWADFRSEQKTLLYAGAPKGALDFDVIVTESDEPEREFFQRISDLLKTAATFAGFAPGQAGSAVSAAFGLGAAVAQLIKAKLQDDAEMRYLGTVGGSRVDLTYGTYVLTRHSQGGASPEIEARIRVKKFEPTHLPKAARIFLDHLEFVSQGSNTIRNLRQEDRVLVDLTVTETPQDQEQDTRIGLLKVDRPYHGENGADWPFTFGLQDKLLYDGEWGLNIAINLNMSGIPRDINEEEWMEVIQQTGAFVGALAEADAQASIRRGFEIAEAVRATVVKFLPKTRFASTVSSALFVGTAIEGLYDLPHQEEPEWQSIEIPLDLGAYGKAIFHLNVKLEF